MVKIVDGVIQREGQDGGVANEATNGSDGIFQSLPCGQWFAVLLIPTLIFLLGLKTALLCTMLGAGIYYYTQMPPGQQVSEDQ